MGTTLQTAPTTWQGLAIRKRYDVEERPLSHAAHIVADELVRLGKHAPLTVLLAAMDRHGLEDVAGLLLDAVCDAPYAFDFYRL